MQRISSNTAIITISRNKCKGDEGWLIMYDLFFPSPQCTNHDNTQACTDLQVLLKTKARASRCPLPSSLIGNPAEISVNLKCYSVHSSCHLSQQHLYSPLSDKSMRQNPTPAQSRMHCPVTDYSPAPDASKTSSSSSMHLTKSSSDYQPPPATQLLPGPPQSHFISILAWPWWNSSCTHHLKQEKL